MFAFSKRSIKLQLAVKPALTGATTSPVKSQDNVFIFRLDSKRDSLVSVDQNSDAFAAEKCFVSLTCVPRLKPWPVILLAVNFVTILLLQFLRFPPALGGSDPRSVAIISSSWTELLGQEVEGFNEFFEVFKRHLLAETNTLQQSSIFRRCYPVKSFFVKFKYDIDFNCAVFDSQTETVINLFWKCMYTCKLWEGSLSVIFLWIMSFVTFSFVWKMYFWFLKSWKRVFS